MSRCPVGHVLAHTGTIRIQQDIQTLDRKLRGLESRSERRVEEKGLLFLQGINLDFSVIQFLS
jgi:hypothetical protein